MKPDFAVNRWCLGVGLRGNSFKGVPNKCTRLRRMRGLTRSFLTDEGGAVTVEWVVLTAGIVTLALAVVLTVSDGVETLGTRINDETEAAAASVTFSK
jgi:Flp pilus assembly pilin Flp